MLDVLRKDRIIAPPGFNRWRVPPASIAIHLCIGSSVWAPRPPTREPKLRSVTLCDTLAGMPMARRLFPASLLPVSLLALFACPSDDSDTDASTDPSATAATTLPATTGDPDSTGASAESSGAGESTAGSAESSGPGESSTGEACAADAECIDDSMCPGGGSCIGCLCIGGNACDPIVPGEWNSCVGPNGNNDNTLCNWVGSGSATGFVGCLSSAGMEGANVCFISGCEDACDCFAPPATGTATITCAEILADGGTGCALDCAGGKVCPDGMVCSENLCFWPPA